MARRTIATVARPTVHAYDPDPEDPLTCRWRSLVRRCGLPRSNSVHDPAAVAAQATAAAERQAAENRRIGDTP